jgi:hypothetical protein
VNHDQAIRPRPLFVRPTGPPVDDEEDPLILDQTSSKFWRMIFVEDGMMELKSGCPKRARCSGRLQNR